MVFGTVVDAASAVVTAIANPLVLFATEFDPVSAEVNAVSNVDAVVITDVSVISDGKVAVFDRSVRSVHFAHDLSVLLSNVTQYLVVLMASTTCPYMHSCIRRFISEFGFATRRLCAPETLCLDVINFSVVLLFVETDKDAILKFHIMYGSLT